MNIDFLFLDEVKQKVERSLENLQLHFVILFVHTADVIEDELSCEAIFFRRNFPLAIWRDMSLIVCVFGVSRVMDAESTKLFNDRLAQWVAKQGFWFQLRYSMAGGGASVLMYHFLRLLLRVLIFLAIVAAVVLLLLSRRTDQVAFKVKLRDQIISGFDCEAGQMRSFNRSQNKASIRYLALQGGPNSYINTCEAAGISFRMGLLDGLMGTWNANQISVDRLSLSVKAGAETPEEAQALGRSLNKRFESLRFQALECKNARISWGYSSRTMGSIAQSQMSVIRTDEGWRIRFTGGTFSQNWLRNLQIKELILVCTEDAVIVETGEFTVPNPQSEPLSNEVTGKVSFHDVRVKGGLRPEFSGSITLENLPLEQLLPEAYHGYVEGSLSGDLKIAGSTNSPDGVSLAGRISLNESDHIILRNRLPLFNSLSILSPAGSYRKTKFSEGYFSLKTGAGSLLVSDIYLSAPEQMDLRGSFEVRPPNAAELDKMVRKGTISSEIAQSIISPGADTGRFPGADNLTLRTAMEMISKDSKNQGLGFDDDIEDNSVPFQSETLQLEMQLKTAQNAAITSVFDGRVTMNLPVAAFPKDSSSLIRLKTSPNGQFYLLECPLTGNLLDLTAAQAEELLLLEKAGQNPPPVKPDEP